MAYDEVLAGRIQDLFFRNKSITAKKMFGGIAFMLSGNMCVGVIKESLIARVGPEEYPAAVVRPHAREFDFTGRPMKGWVVVEADGIEDDDELQRWIQLAMKFVQTLPSKA